MSLPSLQVPEQFKSVFGVGSPRQVFLAKGFRKWGGAILGALFMVGGGIGILVGAFLTFSNIQRYGSAVWSRELGNVFVPIACVSLIFLAIGVGSLWSAYTNWRKAAVIYQDGLGYTDHKGLRTLRWEQITGMTSAVTKHYRNGIYTGTTHVYTLWDREGKKLVINDAFTNVEELANHIRQGIFPHLYKATADSYNAGKTIQFGPVSISKPHGIQLNKKAYKWDEVKEVSVHQGFLKVAKKDGGWFSGANVAVAAIPNLDVLLSIVDQVVGIKAGN